MDTITGAELLVDSLEANDISHVFNIPGVGMFPFVDALADSDAITYVGGLNETAIGLIAEGYSRATRQPGFVNVYHSSGTALAMVALTVAWSDRTPLVFASTTSSRQLSGRDQYAAVPDDITDVPKQYTKWSYAIPSVERIPEAIARAVTVATTPPMGPVHLAFPMDVYRDEVDASIIGATPEPVDGQYPSSPASTATVDESYAETTVYDDATPSEEGLAEAASLLAEAESPLIAAGGEVGQHYATDELVALAEQLGAGVVTEWRSPTYLPMPTDHPLYLGDVMAVSAADVDLFTETDVILSVGFEFTEARVGQYPIQMDDRVVHLTTDERDIGKQVPTDLALVGHPRPALHRLGTLLEDADVGDVEERWERVAGYTEGIEAAAEAKRDALEADDRPTPAERTIASLRDVFSDDLLVVNYAVMSGAYVGVLDFQGPDDFYAISGKASAQGWAAPAGIGVQIAEPDRHVVAINGDGGFMFTSPAAMYTAAYYDVPLTVIVLNNRGWGGGTYDSILENRWDKSGLIGAFDDPPLDFEMLVRGVGVHYERIDSMAAVENSLRSARDHDGPSVVEVSMEFGEGM